MRGNYFDFLGQQICEQISLKKNNYIDFFVKILLYGTF